MSERDELEELALDTRCDRCNAAPRSWCRTNGGKGATSLHAARTNPVYSAFGMGYAQGYADGKARA